MKTTLPVPQTHSSVFVEPKVPFDDIRMLVALGIARARLAREDVLKEEKAS